MKNINALIHINSFEGGAALSCLQYAKALKQIGYNVITCGNIGDNKNEHNYIVNNYIRAVIKTYDIKNINLLFGKVKFLKSIINIRNIYNIIYKNNIDVFLTTCIDDIFFIKNHRDFQHIKRFIIIAGGKANYKRIYKSIIGPNDFICFSMENIESIKKSGFEIKNLWQISNRIECHPDNEWKNHYMLKSDDEIKLFIASRLTIDKIESIKYTINLCKYLNNNNSNAVLHIAGDGPCKAEIEELAEAANKELNKDITIVRGYISDMISEFRYSHIIFGKGRSIIEGLMVNRIGVVVSEADDMSLCNNKNFENLYYYNFSGRQIEYKTSFEDILSLIDEIKNKKLDHNRYMQAFNMVRDKYDSSHLPQKLNNILSHENFGVNKNKRKEMLVIVKIVARYIRYTILRIKGKIDKWRNYG